MKNSKRLLATLLTLCVMASFAFTGTAFAADEADVTLALPAQIVNVNGTAQVVLAGATADEYVSSDISIATVDANGVVTGKAIGRVTITAKNGGTEVASVEIPVVGENLLIRNGVNHGKFEGGAESIHTDKVNRFNLEATGLQYTKAAMFWKAVKDGGVQFASAVTVVDKKNALNEDGKAIKYQIEANGSTRIFRIYSADKANTATEYSTYAYGSIGVENGKLYELTAWADYSDISGMDAALASRVNYYTADGNAVASWLSAGKDSSAVDASVKGWQFMNTTPMARDNFTTTDTYAQVFIGSAASSSDAVNGDIYVTDISFHEVKYEPSFISNGSLNNMKVGDTKSTTFNHLSTTGKEVLLIREDGKGAQRITVTYDSVNKDVATVDSNGKITAIGAGTAIITATATVGGQTVTRTITFVVEKDIVDAFTPDNTDTDAEYHEPTVIAISKDGVGNITSTKNSDGTHNITAPATNGEGKKFLYWAKGLSAQKRILLGETNELTNYVPDAEYADYLIPVYEDDISAPEYYNANGQLIPGATQNTTVSMPGYGTSNGWAQYGDNIYVATYELAKPEEDIEVTVINGTGTDTYAFGDVVTCTANGAEGTFKCWKKNGEIVSCESTYTFKAWENCSVEAVYVETDFRYTGAKMKIIIDSFSVDNEAGVMAEFIGLGNAIEKGIIFTDSANKETKIAMTTKDSQFTVLADPGKYVGYAILRNGDAYTLITDGKYIHD